MISERYQGAKRKANVTGPDDPGRPEQQKPLSWPRGTTIISRSQPGGSMVLRSLAVLLLAQLLHLRQLRLQRTIRKQTEAIRYHFHNGPDK